MALNNLGDGIDSGISTPDTTAIVNGATTASTSVTISAVNSNIFIGQVVTGPGVQLANGIVGPTTITAISASGLVLTLSNPATIANGATLIFGSPLSLVTSSTLSSGTSNSTTVAIVANSFVAVGQLVATQFALGASTVPTAPIYVSKVTSTTSIEVTSPVTISNGATVTFWTAVNVATAVEQPWGNLPMQPNDERATTPVYNIGGAGTQTVTISAASKPTTGTILYTTSAAHGLTVGAIVSTGLYVASGSTVYSTTATVNAGTKDSTLLTTACTTSATHYIAPGTTVTLSSTTPSAYGTSPNGSYVALSVPDKTHVTFSTQSSTFTTNNIGSKDVSVTSLAALTAATVTYYPLDVKEARIISVPSSTTFVVASSNGWSGDSSDSGIGAQSSLTGTLALVADANWSQTNKKQSDRLDGGSLTSVRNGLSYTIPTTSTYATAAYDTYPNYIPGKFAVSTVTATANNIVYSAVNNLTTSNTLNVSGISNPAFNQSGATIVTVKGDTIVTSNPSTTGTVSGATSASNLVTLSAANAAIKVGMGVTGTNVSGTATVTAINGAIITLSSAQSLSNSDTLTFKIAAGTTLTGERGVAAAANFGIGSYIVTAVKGDGTTVTYTAQNNLVASDVVTVTGLSNGAFNLSSATVATANATTFTVTNSGGSGVTLTGQVGKVEYTNAASNIDGGFVSGTYYPQIPNLIGLTATAAADAFSDRGLTALSAGSTTSKGSGATSSAFTRTAGSNVVEITSATHGFVTGDVVLVTGGDATVNGDQTVLVKDVNTVLIVTNSTAAYSGTTALTLTGKVGTVHSQSVAAGTQSQAPSTAVTYSLWA